MRRSPVRPSQAWTVLLAMTLVACTTTSRVARDQDVLQQPQDATEASEALEALEAATVPPAAPVAPVRAGAPSRAPVTSREFPEAALPAGLPMATANPDAMVAHFINVGQGDAILLEFSCGAVLIDTGGERTQRARGSDLLHGYLEEFFQRRADLARTLNLVVLSHPHADHTDGAKVLTNAEPAIDIFNLLDDGEPGTHDSGRSGQLALQQYIAENEGGYLGLGEADITNVSGVTNDVIDPIDCRPGGGVNPKIAALWGHVDLDTAWANDRNNDSVVLRVDFGRASFLFLGDMEHQGLAAMLESYEADQSVFDVDVLKVGHHGSANATTPDFVRTTTPKIAIIQAGDSSFTTEKYNAYTYGHPNRASIRMLVDPASGVSMDRAPKEVRVGIKGQPPGADPPPPQFTRMTVRKAIYSNSWDGNIAVVAKSDGSLQVESEY
jgi:competence protein ComEC